MFDTVLEPILIAVVSVFDEVYYPVIICNWLKFKSGYYCKIQFKKAAQ